MGRRWQTLRRRASASTSMNAKDVRSRSLRSPACSCHYIPKKDGRKRPLGIPTIQDCVVQMAVKLVMEPIFVADFQDSSFGFRLKHIEKQALERIRKACNRKGNWVVDVDIQGYFGNTNQEKLMKLVEMRISDRRILKLIRQ